MKGDFTNSDNFASYFSSYWSQMFGEPAFIQGVADGCSRQLAQHYINLGEAVNASSIRDIAPFHTELVYPIFIKKSEYSVGPKLLTYGGGGVFGPQLPGGKFKEGKTLQFGAGADLNAMFYADLPDDVCGGGSVIMNRLFQPSVIMVAGADFVFEDGVVFFREDIFANPLIPQRAIAGPNGSETVDHEIVLWASGVQIEKFDLYRQYGHLFFDRTVSGPAGRQALESIFNLYSSGPSIARLDSFVAASCGFPVSAEALENVVSIETLGGNQVVVTDLGVYKIPAGLTLRDNVIPGSVLQAGTPLTTATVVQDRFSHPLWWTEIDALTLGRNFVVSGNPVLGFVNKDLPVTLLDTVNVGGFQHQFCKFYLAGQARSVDEFWAETRRRSLDRNEFLAETLWIGAGLLDLEGNPDYSQPLMVNPMRILNDLIGDNLIIIKINEPIQGSITEALHLLRETTPVYCSVVVLFSVSVDEEHSLMADPSYAVPLEELPFEDPAAHYRGDISLFDPVTKGYWENTDPSSGEFLTKTAEALSFGFSPDLISDSIDLGDQSISSENVTARLEPVC